MKDLGDVRYITYEVFLRGEEKVWVLRTENARMAHDKAKELLDAGRNIGISMEITSTHTTEVGMTDLDNLAINEKTVPYWGRSPI